jgi:hypothetical protein
MLFRGRLALCLCLLLFASTALAADVPVATSWKLDRILTTFWSAPPAEPRYLQQLKQQHFNLTWSNEIGLQQVQKAGMKAILLEQAVINLHCLDTPQSRAKVDALVARVRHNPALEMYFVHDEPTGPEMPMVARVVAYLRKLDPAHPAFVNLLPCYASNQQLGAPLISFTAYRDYVRRYVDLAKPEIVSYDHYHFYNGSDSARYFENLDIISSESKRAGIPFINVIQAARFTPRWRQMTGPELRWMAYTTLAYGGKGVAYFLYWGPSSQGGLYRDGKATPLLAEVAKLNEDLLALGTVLGPAKFQCMLPIDARDVVAGMFVNQQELKQYAFVANCSRKEPRQAKLFTAAKRVREFDPNARTWHEIAAKEIRLEPGAGKLIQYE